MKIGFVIGGLGGGGAERVATNLCNYFFSLGHTVNFYTVSFFAGDNYPISKGIACVSLKHSKGKNALAKVHDLFELIKRDHPDVIVAFGTTPSYYAGIVGRKLRIPVIMSERNSPADSDSGFLMSKIRDRAFSLSDGVVFQTEGAKRFFNAKIQEKGTVIPNPLSPGLQYLKRDFSNVDSASVVMLGRVAPQKNYELALDSFVEFHFLFPAFHLEIYGRPAGDYGRKIIQSRSCSFVHFHDFCSDVPSLLSKAGIFLLTSHYEGMSNSLLEAMAAGVPCISTDSRPGAAKEMFGNYEGFVLSKNEDKDDLVRNLKRISSDDYSFYFKSAIRESLLIRQKYDVREIGSKWILLLESCVKCS
jgi:GalNAc-alpha-(1->4)-GalNAc-alpha-(1->3)-diNAcBac-PP-undecaprenol alpha-1,4-N-acetyl-D-galactosaminyltransferase